MLHSGQLLKFSQLRAKLVSGSIKKLETHHGNRQHLYEAISKDAYDFLMSLLVVDPIHRLSNAANALKHKWFVSDCDYTDDSEEHKFDENVMTFEREVSQQASNSRFVVPCNLRDSNDCNTCCCSVPSCVST